MADSPSRRDSSIVAVSPDDFPTVRAHVAELERRASSIDRLPSLNESVWRDLDQPQSESAGFLVADTAYAHVARSDNFAPRHWALGVVVIPEARRDGVRPALIAAAATHVAAHGGGRIILWVLGATDDDDTELASIGMQPARDLYEMRVPLPLAEVPQWPPGIRVRPFEPGRDERAWLDVNNRAFENHAEQGGWIQTTLERRMADAWFDPSLFLLAFDDKGLAGFNWLKLHEGDNREPSLGEIFVIGVDPRMQGTGLGRALALEGLRAINERGADTGSLFVAAENAPAIRLYRSLGFVVHRTDRAYECEVPAR
jgi:mycothiol synthase